MILDWSYSYQENNIITMSENYTKTITDFKEEEEEEESILLFAVAKPNIHL